MPVKNSSIWLCDFITMTVCTCVNRKAENWWFQIDINVFNYVYLQSPPILLWVFYIAISKVGFVRLHQRCFGILATLFVLTWWLLMLVSCNVWVRVREAHDATWIFFAMWLGQPYHISSVRFSIPSVVLSRFGFPRKSLSLFCNCSGIYFYEYITKQNHIFILNRKPIMKPAQHNQQVVCMQTWIN